MFLSINPATGGELARYEPHSAADVDQALGEAVAAQRAWRKTRMVERCALLRKVAQALRAERDTYALLITQEMGKPIREAEAEIEKSAWTCEFYAEHAPRFLADELIPSNATESRVVFDPLGVVLAVMPWNYPFWQFFRFFAPAIAAGNGSILKHAANVPGCALAIEQALVNAGVPAGLSRSLLIPSSAVAGLIGDDRIAAVTLTGSTPVGQLVAAEAGKHLKKQVLELGGTDPFIVLADADIARAAEFGARARFQNTGQSCIAAKRFIVEEKVADAFTEQFISHVRALRTGDPMDRDTQVGPIARADLRDDLHRQVMQSVREGAHVALGGDAIAGPGAFYAPTVLDHVELDMTACREEIFGPVAPIIRVRDAEQAVAVANDTEYGLGAALWTGDLSRAYHLARDIEAGAVFVNGQVASDARLPFGGIKKSGYGRELGVYGIREFTNIKTLWVGPAQV
ncbi:NAD-dependent succinate-semialdehyde dehydrogenase [Ancylobacter sonchi]|uniref:NAD-dependent succinate-semialdehyde dehydrogenase n=1 Tax=Ancylobacter sonchi TaxID=1937790 RepID=UPI001BD6578E|nr:NAD-dependent succinate-semialdehyde dehydrogenase [Ancylobacter sonchi]MBS7532472.1 NAD-dependent succinate-semialdehyde dehydrogenase [Ancylobacter sonchi]